MYFFLGIFIVVFSAGVSLILDHQRVTANNKQSKRKDPSTDPNAVLDANRQFPSIVGEYAVMTKKDVDNSTHMAVIVRHMELGFFLAQTNLGCSNVWRKINVNTDYVIGTLDVTSEHFEAEYTDLLTKAEERAVILNRYNPNKKASA